MFLCVSSLVKLKSGLRSLICAASDFFVYFIENPNFLTLIISTFSLAFHGELS